MIKKLKRRKVYARFRDNTWAADLAEMRSLYSVSCGVKYLLCVIYAFTKCAWVKPLKDETKTVLHGFIEIGLWVDQGKEFYNNYMQNC